MPVEKRQFRDTGPLNPINWANRGACVNMDTDLFYPDGEKDGAVWTSPDWETPRQVCLTCEVRQECLDYAMATDEEFGVWGGYTPDERKALKRHGLRPTFSDIRTGSRNSIDRTMVDSMLAKMDSGKPSLGRSKSRKRTSR